MTDSFLPNANYVCLCECECVVLLINIHAPWKCMYKYIIKCISIYLFLGTYAWQMLRYHNAFVFMHSYNYCTMFGTK